MSAPLGPPSQGLAAASILKSLSQPSATCTNLPPLHPTLAAGFTVDSSAAPRLYLACALTPYRHVTYEDAKGKVHSATEAALRDGVKLGVQNHYLDGIPALFSAADLLRIPCIDGHKERVRIGLLLREKAVHNVHTGSHWTTSLLFSLVQELVPLWNTKTNSMDEILAAGIIQAYNTFVSRVKELGLDTAVDAKPLLDGKEVVCILDAGKPGAWTGKVLASIVEWQLEFPEGTKEECEQWLRAQQAAGKISFEVAAPPRAAPAKRGKGDGRGSGAKKSKRERVE